jgi:uncharacterized protein (TIGR03437 family)
LLFALTFYSVKLPLVYEVVNGASYQVQSTISPGQVVTIFGEDFGPERLTTLALDRLGRVSTALDETRVLFNGIPAPLLYVSGTQIGAVVPYGLDPLRGIADVYVEHRGIRRPVPKVVAIVETSPGIFTADSSGRGPGAILNQNASLNSNANPAPVGSVVSIFATGEGQTNPAGVDGRIASAPLPRPRQPVSVAIGGRAAEVLYAGAAPGLVSGVMQVNARVPSGAGAGAILIVLTVGSRSSQPGVTIAVQPEPPGVTGVSLTPASVTAGTSAMGRVTLNVGAPQGGALVTLQSSDPAVAQVPASVTVPVGQTSATFTVTTRPVAARVSVLISASYAGRGAGTSLVVNPAPTCQSTIREGMLLEGALTTANGRTNVIVGLFSIFAGTFTATVNADIPARDLFEVFFDSAGFNGNTIEWSTVLYGNYIVSLQNIEPLTGGRMRLNFAGCGQGAPFAGTLSLSTRNRRIEGELSGRVAYGN